MLSSLRRADAADVADAAASDRSGHATSRVDLATVFLVAVALRLIAGVMLSRTYDYDEFIVLTLSREFAHGAHPYSDFVFFHPPGSLLVGRLLDPLTSLWWPSARVFTGLVDSATAALTYSLGRSFLPRRTAIVAGLVYAVSPLALIAAVRVGPDPLIAFLAVAGLCVLVRTRSGPAALAAGALLGLAIGTKYTAALVLPAYILAAPRRTLVTAVGAGGALLLLLAPYLSVAHAVQQQTIVFQSGRGYMPLDERLTTVALYWLVVSPLVVLRLRRRAPTWVWAGFLAGGALLLAPQVFYHYFVLFAPFAALLSAPLVAGIRRPTYRPITVLATCGLVWVAVVAMGDDRPLLVTTGHLSDLTPTVEVLRHETAPGGLVLADRYEYPFLSGRPTLAPYFWNVRPLVSGTTLEHQLPCAAAVVMSSGASSGYPQGLISYLDRHYRARRQGGATVWVLPATATATTGVRATGARVRPPCEKFVFVPRGPCPRERCVPAPSMDEIKLVSDRDKG